MPNKPQKGEKSLVTKKIKKILIKIGLGFLILILGCAIFIAAFKVAYAQKVLPHVSVGETDLGGKTKSEVRAILDQKIRDSQSQTLKLYYTDKSWELKNQELSVNYDLDKSVKNVWDVGHGGVFWQDWYQLLVSPFVSLQAKADYKLKSDVLDSKITVIKKAVNRSYKDATLSIQDGQVSVISEEIGLEIKEKKFREALDGSFSGINFKPLEVPVDRQEPKVDAKIAAKAIDEIRAIIAYPIEATANDKTYTITKDQIGSWLDFQPAAVIGGDSGQGTQDSHLVYDLKVKISDQKLDDFIKKNLSSRFTLEPQDAKLGISGGKVVVTQKDVIGSQLDEAQTKTLFLAAIKKNVPRAVTLPVEVKEATIREDNITELGIVEKIGEGTTSFAKSPSNRIHNINVGVGTLNGAFIKPGESFSTIGKLGNIDASTGYLPELVIKDNKTIPEYGGGLCQVSTTLFRTALNAGLTIEERQNHSYRVSYYEPPIGLDATVYSPKPDLKFKNDTPGYILIQGFTSGSKITFQFFGTADGRTTKIDGPTVYNYVSPPDSIYEETTDLAPGETVQVEKAHTGATAKAVYHVYRGGKEINNQEFISVYKALPAVYRVGKQVETTAAPVAETPTATATPSPPPVVETPPPIP